MYKTLCISGGGISGICVISALKCLEENKIFNNNKIKNYVGTSVGSIINFILILDYKIDFILEFFKSFNLNDLFSNIDIENLFENYGLNKGNEFKKTLQSFLFNKLQKNDITFDELYKLTKKRIGIIGTNISKNREEYFSLETTPNMSVLLAINISIRIPIILTPIKYNNNYYIDGGISNNFPINYCNKNKTLGIILHNKINHNITNFNTCITAIYDNIFKFINYKHEFNINNTIILNGIKGYSINDNKLNETLKKSKDQTIKFIINNNKMIIYSLVNDLIDSFFIQLKI